MQVQLTVDTRKLKNNNTNTCNCTKTGFLLAFANRKPVLRRIPFLPERDPGTQYLIRGVAILSATSSSLVRYRKQGVRRALRRH